MILVAGHDEERNRHSCFTDYVHQVLDQTLHNVDRFRDAYVVHAFGIIGTQPCSHAACKQYGADLLFPQRFQADLGKVFFVFLNLRDLHGSERGDLSSGLVAVRVSRIADDREISLIDLLQKSFLLLIRELVIIIKNVKLSIFFQFLSGILQIHRLTLLF